MGWDGRDAEAIRAFRGLLNVHVRTPDTQQWKQLQTQVRTRLQESPFYYKMEPHAKVVQLLQMRHTLWLIIAWQTRSSLKNLFHWRRFLF